MEHTHKFIAILFNVDVVKKNYIACRYCDISTCIKSINFFGIALILITEIWLSAYGDEGTVVVMVM